MIYILQKRRRTIRFPYKCCRKYKKTAARKSFPRGGLLCKNGIKQIKSAVFSTIPGRKNEIKSTRSMVFHIEKCYIKVIMWIYITTGS